MPILHALDMCGPCANTKKIQLGAWSHNMIQLLTSTSKNDINTLAAETPGNCVAAPKKGSSLRRSRHHHGNLAVKHFHKNARTASVRSSNRESQDVTSRTHPSYIRKMSLFKHISMVPLVPPCCQVALRKSTFKFSGSS